MPIQFTATVIACFTIVVVIVAGRQQYVAGMLIYGFETSVRECVCVCHVRVRVCVCCMKTI